MLVRQKCTAGIFMPKMRSVPRKSGVSSAETLEKCARYPKIERYMGFSFNFFGTQEVRKFSYKPRFYDPETEERRKKYGDFTKPKETKYVPGQHVKGSFRDGNYQRTKEVSRNQKTIGMVTMVLLFAVVYLLFKYFPLLVDSLGK